MAALRHLWEKSKRSATQALFLIACAGFAGALPADVRAAELKVDFAELAALVRELTKDAKVHLHNVPAGFLGALTAPSPSYFEIVGHHVGLDVPAQDGTAPLIGTYSYYVNDINLRSLTVSSTATAVRIVLELQGPGYELVPSDDRLPSVHWDRPTIAFDFVPIQVGSSVSLAAANIEVRGTLKPACTNDTLYCNVLAINKARVEVKGIPNKIRDLLKAQINGPKVRDALAAKLEGALTIGKLGQVKIRSVKPTPTGVVVSFCLEGC